MYTTRNSTTRLMQALSLLVLYGSTALGMKNTDPQIIKWNTKYEGYVQGFFYTQPRATDHNLHAYFFAKNQANRWADGEPHAKCSILPLENSIDSNCFVAPGYNVMHLYRHLNVGEDVCTYATHETGKTILGFSRGFIVVDDGKGWWEKNLYDDFKKPVSACAFGHPFSIGSYPDQQSVLVGYPDRSLALIDRKHKRFKALYNAHPDPITSIMAGHEPNMWVIGGGSCVTIMKFEQSSSVSDDKLLRKFALLRFCKNALSPLPVKVIGLYKCGIIIQAQDDSGSSSKLIMPYSPDEYTAIQKCQSSPKQVDLVLRIIAAKEAGSPVDLTNCTLLPAVMKTMLMEP
jgi:hypothetical protein